MTADEPGNCIGGITAAGSPHGTGRTRMLVVYFFWDEDTNQVVVGWLPSHLSNRIS